MLLDQEAPASKLPPTLADFSSQYFYGLLPGRVLRFVLADDESLRFSQLRVAIDVSLLTASVRSP